MQLPKLAEKNLGEVKSKIQRHEEEKQKLTSERSTTVQKSIARDRRIREVDKRITRNLKRQTEIATELEKADDEYSIQKRLVEELQEKIRRDTRHYPDSWYT